MGTPITPYGSGDAKKAQVAQMFDNIAHRYDFLNHFFSLGIDKLWRRKAVRMLLSNGPNEILDVDTGTADFAIEAARKAPELKVIGVDISDQRADNDPGPENFDLVVYDGYHLDLPAESVDVAFSYQFLEHLHPDDVDPHFQIVHRLLKPGGVYVFDTPHRFSGPHDISRYFGDGLDCFHFQEWTFREMRRLLTRNGFHSSHPHRGGRIRTSSGFRILHEGLESLVDILPKALRQKLSARLFQSVALSAVK